MGNTQKCKFCNWADLEGNSEFLFDVSLGKILNDNIRVTAKILHDKVWVDACIGKTDIHKEKNIKIKFCPMCGRRLQKE